jgi:alcohol dehydrogenase class IV
VTYAFSTALISVFPHVGQGESYAALVGAVLEHFGGRDPESMTRIGTALGVWDASQPATGAPPRIAAKMAEVFHGLGLATRLSALGIDRARLPQVLEISLRNFNADPKREFVKERDRLGATLEAAW